MAHMQDDSASTEVVVAFDFDGTLSHRDNFVPFLLRFAGIPAAARGFATAGLRVAGRGRENWSRNELKAAVLHELLAGRDAADLDDTARQFADEIIRNHLDADALARVEWHREQGHRLVIVSASLGAYLRPVAQHLRFDDVLATELEVGDDGRLTGRMLGANVRGPEKARRLDAWIADACHDPKPFVWAYGDSSGDRELWARADRAIRLGKRAHHGTA
jgi:phosphatidylglycerophosphatase C